MSYTAVIIIIIIFTTNEYDWNAVQCKKTSTALKGKKKIYDRVTPKSQISQMSLALRR